MEPNQGDAGMKEIPLTRGKVAIVDDDAYEELSKYRWYCTNKGYATRTARPRFGKRHEILMHRVIMQTPARMEIDHINGNPLDNRRENLRVCKHSENLKNMKRYSNNTSGFKGVSWYKRDNKWKTEIMINGKSTYLGLFDDKRVAAQAYDDAAKEHF